MAQASTHAQAVQSQAAFMPPAPLMQEQPLQLPQQQVPPLQQHLQYLQAQLPHALSTVPGIRAPAPHFGGLGRGIRHLMQPQSHLRDGVPATAQEVVSAIMEYMSRPNSAKPPAGCAPDAIKLFIGNIPKHCTEAVLHKVFQCYGLIVEIAVVRAVFHLCPACARRQGMVMLAISKARSCPCCSVLGSTQRQKHFTCHQRADCTSHSLVTIVTNEQCCCRRATAIPRRAKAQHLSGTLRAWKQRGQFCRCIVDMRSQMPKANTCAS